MGTNRYAYSDNDPVNKSDPNGHSYVDAPGRDPAGEKDKEAAPDKGVKVAADTSARVTPNAQQLSEKLTNLRTISGPPRTPGNVQQNQMVEIQREQKARDVLAKENPEKTIMSQKLLRDERGNIVKDPRTDEARRVDFVVVDPATKKGQAVEVTGPNVNKTSQIQKEQNIFRELDNRVFVKDRKTDQFIKLTGPSTIMRIP